MDEILDNIIVLTDEAGNEIRFEFLDLIECCGNEYAVVAEADVDTEEVVIFKVEGTDGEDEEYIGVDDENELSLVFEIFKERNKDIFNFAE